MKDRIMILGGANLHCKLVEAAHQMGKETVVVDNINNSPAKLISDYRYDIDVKNVRRLVEICQQQKIKAVISAYLDFCQPYYQEICSILGVPCFGTYEQFCTFTDKALFKKRCREYDVSTVLGYTEAQVQLLDEEKYPIYIKPSMSQGSKGQSVCNSREEVLNAIEYAKKISGNNEVVIEKYMDNKPIIQVTYLVVDGIPKLIRTADQINGNQKNGMGHIAVAGISPSRYTELFLEKADCKIKNFIRGVGIKNGPVFMQGFVDKNEFYFFDPGLRFPGTEASRIFKKLMNIDLMQAMVGFAFSGNLAGLRGVIDANTVYLKNKIIVNLFPFIRKGIIKNITPVEEILKIKGVEYMTYRHVLGDAIEDTKDVNQRIAEINLLCDSKEELRIVINQIYDTLQVLDESDNQMVMDQLII